MAQPLTSAFETQANAHFNEPVLLVRLILSSPSALTRYLTTRAGTYGGQIYEELLKEGITLRMGLGRFGEAERSVGHLVIANEDDLTGVRFSDLLGQYVFTNAEIQADQIFHRMDIAGALRLFKGSLQVPEMDCFDDQQVRLELLDDGQPATRQLVALGANRIHKLLGSRITTSEYPSADPDVIGMMKPELYGAVIETRGLPVDAGAVDVMPADMTAAQTTVPLSDPDQFALFPSSGTVQAEDEQISYTGKDSGARTLTGCTRGVNATTAAAHTKGKYVWEIQAEYTYLVAAHACKSVSNVKVDGIYQTSGYTLDLTGPTLIKFTSKPRRSLTVAVTVQPIHAGTVSAEQTPGAISTTQEQAPGSISTTQEQTPGSIATSQEQTPGSISTGQEHGHSTGTGSHDHGVGDKTHEYQSSPSLPASFTANQTFDFANTPKSGTTANWLIKVTATSGTWTWRLGGAIVATLAVGDNYFTEASPGTQYILQEDAAGQITIELVERDITRAATADAGPASGVSTGLTGGTATSMASLASATATAMALLDSATATSMASLASATATSMGSLAGSTAVSVSRTTDVVVSPADLEVGELVLCDAEGYPDDGSGTYTGTPNALITNPADQIRHILAVQLGLSLAEYAVLGFQEIGLRRQNTASRAKGEGVTILTWDHLVEPGTELALVVGITEDDPTGVITQVTYNGLPLTKIGQHSNLLAGAPSAWILLNPPVGVHQIAVTFLFASYPVAGAVSFEGVDQTTPVAGAGGSDGTGTSATRATPTASGDFAFCVVSVFGDHTASWADNAGDVQNWKDATTQGTGVSTGEAAGGGSTTVGGTWTGSDGWAIYSFALKAGPVRRVPNGSFDEARTDFAAAGIRADWGLYAQIDSSELLERLRWSVGSRLFLNQEGKFKLIVLPGTGSIQKIITETDDVLGPGSGGHPIKVGRSSHATLLNRIYFRYKREVVTGNYFSLVDVSDAASKAAYRTENTLLIENDFVRDATAATAIANKYLAWHKDVKWIATIPVLALPTLHFELMDKIAITSSRMPGGGWTAKEFWVERIERTLSPPGQQPDRCVLVCREV